MADTVVHHRDFWDDLRVDLTRVTAGGNSPTWSQFADDGGLGNTGSSTGVYLWHFPSNSETEVHFSMQLPHAHKYLSDLRPHVHWVQPEGTTGQGVRWGLEYTFAEVNNAFGATTIIGGSGLTTAVAGTHLVTSLGTISGAAIDSASGMLVCRLFRDHDHADDDYAQSVPVMEFDIHYQRDAPGSREEFVK